jgi:hypothetical protein
VVKTDIRESPNPRERPISVQALLPIVIIALYFRLGGLFRERAMIATSGIHSADRIRPEQIPFHLVRHGGQYLSPRGTLAILPTSRAYDYPIWRQLIFRSHLPNKT